MKKFRGVEHHKLQAIGSNYNYCLRRIETMIAKGYLSESEKDIYKIYHAYVLNVERCFVEFNCLEKSILEKEYFTPLPPMWWMDIYSRSTYYRLRLNIARKFLHIYEK